MDGSHITNDIEKLLADFDFDAGKVEKKKQRADSEKEDEASSGSEGVATRPASAGAGDHLAEGLKRMSSSLSSSSQELSSLVGGRGADEGDSTGWISPMSQTNSASPLEGRSSATSDNKVAAIATPVTTSAASNAWNHNRTESCSTGSEFGLSPASLGGILGGAGEIWGGDYAVMSRPKEEEPQQPLPTLPSLKLNYPAEDILSNGSAAFNQNLVMLAALQLQNNDEGHQQQQPNNPMEPQQQQFYNRSRSAYNERNNYQSHRQSSFQPQQNNGEQRPFFNQHLFPQRQQQQSYRGGRQQQQQHHQQRMQPHNNGDFQPRGAGGMRPQHQQQHSNQYERHHVPQAAAASGPVMPQTQSAVSQLTNVTPHELAQIGANSSPMNIRHKFGSLGSGEGQFNAPHGFCLGAKEQIIVADTNNHRIQVYGKDGAFLGQFGVAGKDEGRLWFPRKVAVIRPSGQFVICDRGNERSRMQVFDRYGNFVRRIAIRYIDIVAGLAVNRFGHIVAVDSVTPTVFVIDPNTGILVNYFECSGMMTEPSDIAVFGNEYYICDFKGHCVVVIDDETGREIRKIGNETVTCFPNGIDISDQGDVLVGDSHGNQFHVAVFEKNGLLASEFMCPHVKVSRCCGLKISSEGYIVTLAKNNHHVLVLDTLFVV